MIEYSGAIKMFNWIRRWFKKEEEFKAEPRMYLILREDLAYKYIQGAHALAQYSLSYPEPFQEWCNRHLICLSVFNGLALKNLVVQFLRAQNQCGDDSSENMVFTTFIEPDLESSLPTALCFFCNDTGPSPFRELIKHLKLATK